jgi:dolichol-phosphate mannosyltransferase
VLSDSLVIIPTYNEKENIENIIRKVFSLPDVFHILIVDDGSPDGTATIVKSLQKEFEGMLHIEERKGKLGLGTAYIHGFKWALKRHYEYIFEMDADFSHNPQDLIKLKSACIEGRIVLETIPLDKIKFIGYAFQIEMKFTAIKFGFKVSEVPIIFTDRTEGTSKMSTHIFREAFLGVIQIKLTSFFRDYSRNLDSKK